MRRAWIGLQDLFAIKGIEAKAEAETAVDSDKGAICKWDDAILDEQQNPNNLNSPGLPSLSLSSSRIIFKFNPILIFGSDTVHRLILYKSHLSWIEIELFTCAN